MWSNPWLQTLWWTFGVLLVPGNPEATSVTVAPPTGVKGRLETQMTLNCGDGNTAGLVLYWYTPFGLLQDPGLHSDREPVFMQPDGSLMILNSSCLHGGLYYCLLQDAQGTTLWPYHVCIHQDHGKQEADGDLAAFRVKTDVRSEDDKSTRVSEQQGGGCGAFRARRDVGFEDDESTGVSEQQFAGAVTTSVLLTFVVGFSAGALSRAYVLRCLRTIRTGMLLPRRRLEEIDTQRHGSAVTMTMLPPMYNDQEPYEVYLETDQVRDEDTIDTTVSSATSLPPAKPKRSFRHKGDEKKEDTTATYLESCDHVKQEEEPREEGEGKDSEERNQKKARKFYLSGDDEKSQSDEEEEEEEEENERREGMEGNDERREEVKERREEVKGGDEEKREDAMEGRLETKEGIEERREEVKERREEMEGNEERRQGIKERKEEGKERREEVKDRGEEMKEGLEERREEMNDGIDDRKELKEEVGENRSEEDQNSDSKSEIEMSDKQQNQEDALNGVQGTSSSAEPSRGRRSRVIRLYQYDEDGQRYGHLPDPALDEPGPAPRLRQRSVSLTRLSAIMAAASAGPMDTGGGEGTKREEGLFSMDV